MANDELGEVTKLVILLEQNEAHAAALSLELKEASERVRVLKEESIPSAMEELGYKSVELGDGTKISVKGEVYASISAERQAEAFAWLESHGFGGLIKDTTTVDFKKNQTEESKKLMEFLQTLGVEFGNKRGVHSSTLKSFLKEQLAEGSDIPLETFGARSVNVASVKRPSTAKFKLGE